MFATQRFPSFQRLLSQDEKEVRSITMWWVGGFRMRGTHGACLPISVSDLVSVSVSVSLPIFPIREGESEQ